MPIAQRLDFVSSQASLRSRDGLIIAAYAAAAIVVLVLMYFASGGAGFSSADIASLAALP